jgi:hypothetical protein
MKIQGPMRAVDVLDTLAWLDALSRDCMAEHGVAYGGDYYSAWRWLTAVVLDNPRPELLPYMREALINAQSSDHRLEAGR